jgi:hypothetical protein
MSDNSEEEVSPPACWICMSNETDNTELGKLFHPCRCNGSIKYVHVNCLNTWRHLSTNSNIFYQCGLCHYNYKFYRLDSYMLLRNRIFHFIVALIIIAIALYISGFMSLWGHFDLTSNSILNHYLRGGVIIGSGGFISLISFGGFVRPTPYWSTRSIDGKKEIVITIVLLAFIGLLVSIYKMFEVTKNYCDRVLTSFGEHILEVDE